jgi:dihydroxyacetone kinase
MFIIPKRTMQLDDRQVVAGKKEEVSESEGKLAIKHGWAIEIKLTKAEKAAAEAAEKAAAEAAEKAAAEAAEKAAAEAAEKAAAEAAEKGSD